MHRLFLTLSCLALLLGAATLASCDKTPMNGDLDGMWRLTEMHSKPTADAPTYSLQADLGAQRIFWNFQLRLLSIQNHDSLANSETNETVARFEHSGNRLHVTHTYIHHRAEDILITDPATTQLEHVGIRGCSSSFEVKCLTSKRMVLCSERDSLVFRKY